MSDINDLIHTSAKLAYESGVNHERTRITALLKDLPKEFHYNDYSQRTVAKAIQVINDTKKN